MTLYQGIDEIPQSFGPSAVAIGKFDGVHVGHRAVLARLLDEARPAGLVPTVLTFDRNPLALFAPDRCPAPLVSNAQRAELLAAAGVEAVVEARFDRAFSELTPEAFVDEVLIGALHASVVLVGADFRFGHRRAGDVARLRELTAAHGATVVVVDDVVDAGARVSSTGIRALLDAGRVGEAAELLGRLPAIRGVVVHGEERGRELGYPTANVAPDLEGYLPADGVYAVWATVDGVRYGAEASIGNNPTFEGVPQHQLEVHVFDQRIDLYDRVIEVEFAAYIRPMAAFDGVDALVAQLQADDDRIRALLGLRPRT